MNAWIRRKRCPHCVNSAKRNECAYKVMKYENTWKCCGYRSKHWDERTWVGSGAEER